MRTEKFIGIAVALLAVLACSGGDGESGTLRLPDGYYGEWELTGTSGGMDGRGFDVGEGIRLVLARGHVAEHHAPGKPSTKEKFTVRRDKSIFSTEPMWFFVADGDAMGGRVVELSEDGNQLTLSDNHPDGFNHHYRRLE